MGPILDMGNFPMRSGPELLSCVISVVARKFVMQYVQEMGIRKISTAS